ncbi:MAG: PEP-CTERM sorting domain-containing protein [Acidobacteriota bacterium]
MRKSSFISSTLGFLLLFAKLQAANVGYEGLFNNSFQLNGFNYANQLVADSTDQSAKDLEYHGNGITQQSYYSFTTTGMPTYPILGSSTMFGLSIYVPVSANPQPSVLPAASPNLQQLQGFSTRSFADTQNVMLVNQILDNSTPTSGVNWTSQSSNPYANMFGSMFGSASGFSVLGGNVFNVPVQQPQAQTLLQRDGNGQTFVNTFAAQAVMTTGGFVNISATDVPEPATAAMLTLGLVALAALFTLRKRVIPSA